MRLVRRPLANRDLLTIAFYLDDQAGAAIAERFLAQVEQGLAQLVEMPLLGSPWHSDNPRFQDLRIWPVRGFRKYLLVYIASHECVDLVRILHGSRNIQRILDTSEDG
jgi:toxin ParE1/3/4